MSKQLNFSSIKAISARRYVLTIDNKNRKKTKTKQSDKNTPIKVVLAECPASFYEALISKWQSTVDAH